MHILGGRITVREADRNFIWALTEAGRDFVAAVASAEANEAKDKGAKL